MRILYHCFLFYSTHMTEILEDDDLRTLCTEMQKEITKEVDWIPKI